MKRLWKVSGWSFHCVVRWHFHLIGVWFFIKFHFVAMTSCYKICSERWLAPWIKQMVRHIQKCVCSGGAGPTASSNKKCMPCLGRVCLFSGDGWALWIVTSKHKHEFWQTCFTPACAHTPGSGVIHQSHRYWCVRALPAHSWITWKYLRALAPTHVGSHGAGGEILIFTKWLTLNTWFLHLWHPVCLFFF